MVRDEQKIKSVLKDFNVRNEKDFYSFINTTWNLCKCTKCGKSINLLNCDFINGNPTCKDNSCFI